MLNKLIGTSGDNLLIATREKNWVEANQGNDTIHFHEDGGTAFGGVGDDVFHLSPPGVAQVHAYGGQGDDTFYIDTSSRVAPFGVHIWGGEGRDKFKFTNLNASDVKMTGRLDDFDPSRDEIWIEDTKLDFANLPENVRLLEYHGQAWIMIDERVLYTLEGARQVVNDEVDTHEEVHFIYWPPEWANGVPESYNLSYPDFVNYFPEPEMTIPDGDLTHWRGTDRADTLTGGAGNDYLHGGDGHDRLSGHGGHDVIDGGEMNDLIYGGAGNDSLSGGLDQDTIYGGADNDLIYGGTGHDVLYGDAGDDTVHGDHGHDLIYGGTGNDSLTGGTGNDVLLGGAGSDTLLGGKGDDLLIADGSGSGVEGENILDGGDGNDTLVGADGQTTEMSGGQGEDVFVPTENGEVIIKDFDASADLLDLRGQFDPSDNLEDFVDRIKREDGGFDLRIDLPGGGWVMMERAGELSEDELSQAVLRDGPAEDINAAVDAQKRLIDDDPDLFGAGEHRGEAPHDHGAQPPSEAAGHGGGGCFVATASFGNVAHPDVTWLRKFRDTKLVHSRSGRAFIRFYWKVGPVMGRYVNAQGPSGAVSRSLISALVRLLKRLS